jgi:hypothetical protein
MMYKSLLVFGSLGLASAGRPSGSVWVDANQGLSAAGLQGGTSVEASLNDKSSAGADIDFGTDSVSPRNAWFQYKDSVSDGVEATARATYDFGGHDTQVEVDFESSGGILGDGRSSFGATLGSKVRGFIGELRTSQAFQAFGGQQSVLEASYDVPSRSAAATLNHALNGDETEVSVGWKQEGNNAFLKLVQRVPGANTVVTPQVDLRSGAVQCEVDAKISDSANLKVDVNNDKVANFEWTDNADGGNWKTSGTVPLDNWKDGSVSFRRSWTF